MISDIAFSIGLYLPNRTCIAFSQTNKYYRKLFTSDRFWKSKLRYDLRFLEKTYISYVNYQRQKMFLSYKVHLHVISTDNCDKSLLSSLIEYTLHNRIHPWLQEQLLTLQSQQVIKRGDIISLSNIDIDDSCKYIYSGLYFEHLEVHRDGSMIIPNKYSVITEFPIYYWSKALSSSYVPLDIYKQVFDIVYMDLYSYLKIIRNNFCYYLIVGIDPNSFRSIITSNSLLSFLNSCYYSYTDPYPQIPKIKTGKRRTLYTIWNGK